MRGRNKAAVPIGIVVILAVLLYTRWGWFHDLVDGIHSKAQSASPSDVTAKVGDEIDKATSAAGKTTIHTTTPSKSAPTTAKNLPKTGSTGTGKNTTTPGGDKYVLTTTGVGKGGPTGNAMKVLDTLIVKGKAPMTGYNRTKDFGPAWTDNTAAPLANNSCDTRNDILQRDLVDITFRDDDPDCTVATGILSDPYTGKVIHFARGVKTSSAVQIDHSVALGNVWVSGGQQITQEQREAIANDPLNLLAVDGPSNESKGASNAAEWLPPNKSYRCSYVARQIAVKAKYGLSVTAPEKAAMQRVLAKCPDQGIPTE